MNGDMEAAYAGVLCGMSGPKQAKALPAPLRRPYNAQSSGRSGVRMGLIMTSTSAAWPFSVA